MTNIKELDVTAQLIGLGFEGKFLTDLQTMIHSSKDYENFQNFIIMNDSKLRTRLMIVSEYRRLLVSKRSIMSEETFINRIKNASTLECKINIIEELFLHSVEPTNYLYHRIVEFIDNDNFLSEVYNRYLEYPLNNPLSYVKVIYSKYRKMNPTYTIV